MKGFIRTIAGDIRTSEVRYAVTHEHGFLPLNKESASKLKKLKPVIEQRLVREFKTLLGQGANTFVDVTPIGYARMTDLWLRASQRTGMHVVATTGYYAEPTLPPSVRKASVDKLASVMHKELVDGIGDTGCRAGIVKVATHEYEILPTEKKIFLAAAAVQKKTGCPITTHSPKATLAEFKMLTEHGVAPERIALGHIEVSPWEDVKNVMDKGAMFLFTNFGGVDIVPEDVVIAQMADLIRRGHLRQIMISVDMYIYAKKGRLVYRWPGGYEQLIGRVVPRMVKYGIKPRHIETMLHENPARHLAWQ